MPAASATASPPSPPVDTLSFEEAMAELERIVRALESGEGSLEDSMKSYERGTALKEHCMKRLASARLQVERIATGSDGAITAAPFEEQP